MVELFHDLHLSFHALTSIRFHEFDFLIDLDSNLLIEHLMEAEAYHCISSRSDPLPDEVIV